jgi:uncharacterized membrane protein YqjE
MTDDPVRSAGGTLGGYSYPVRTDRTMSEVVQDIFVNVQEMVRAEIRLARAELRQDVTNAAGSAKLIAAGAGIAVMGVVFILVTVTLLLALVMPAWAATLIMGAILAIAGMATLSKGRAQFKMPRPDKTIENVKENVEWMKDQTRS